MPLFLFVDFVIFSAALAALLVVTSTSIKMDHPDNPEKLIKTEIKPGILYHAFLHEFNQLSGACLPSWQHQRWASHPVSPVVVYFSTLFTVAQMCKWQMARAILSPQYSVIKLCTLFTFASLMSCNTLQLIQSRQRPFYLSSGLLTHRISLLSKFFLTTFKVVLCLHSVYILSIQ